MTTRARKNARAKQARERRARERELRKSGKLLSTPSKVRAMDKPGTGLSSDANNISIAPAILSAVESQILNLVNVERADPSEVADILNRAQETQAWTVERVGGTLERARAKLLRAGEIEAARPSAYAAENARLRYGAIIRGMRAELAQIESAPETATLRAKLLRLIADVERMGDDAVTAITGKSVPNVGALVYVSRLRDGGEPATPPREPLDAQAENARSSAPNA